MSASGSMSARDRGITEQSVPTILDEALSSFPKPPLPDGTSTSSLHTVFAHASLTGAWSGTVALRMPVSVASSLTSALFTIPTGEISTVERADVVGELSNVIAGNLKGLIGGGTTLSLPVVIEGDAEATDNRAVSLTGAVVVDFVYPFLGQLIAVQIIEYENSAP
jgi:CheY-specific phosphatase CheX